MSFAIAGVTCEKVSPVGMMAGIKTAPEATTSDMTLSSWSPE